MTTSNQRPAPGGGPAAPDDPTLRLHGLAHNLKNKTGAAYLAATSTTVLGEEIPPQAYDVYLQRLLQEAGNPSDPIERMLIEQIAMAHHNIARLHIRASKAATVEHAKVYNSAAVRLLAEFRRSALALKKYREPTAAKHFTVVRQQNLAHNQQVAYVAPAVADSTDIDNQPKNFLNNPSSELGSNHALEHHPTQSNIPQPQTGRSRQTEPIEAAGTVRRRT